MLLTQRFSPAFHWVFLCLKQLAEGTALSVKVKVHMKIFKQTAVHIKLRLALLLLCIVLSIFFSLLIYAFLKTYFSNFLQ